jgi:hypothetical protein
LAGCASCHNATHNTRRPLQATPYCKTALHWQPARDAVEALHLRPRLASHSKLKITDSGKACSKVTAPHGAVSAWRRWPQTRRAASRAAHWCTPPELQRQNRTRISRSPLPRRRRSSHRIAGGPRRNLRRQSVPPMMESPRAGKRVLVSRAADGAASTRIRLQRTARLEDN